MQPQMPRRLVAILAADAVDYSRLMHRDEDAGMTVLMQRRQLLESEIVRHRGRVFSGAGDSVLAEFTSAVDSVRCALASQRLLQSANAEDAVDHRLAFRIGINLGDVIVTDDGNLYGDCVNLASRLETVAKPGGICLSEEAYRQVRNCSDLHFSDLGQVPLKNLGEVRVYQVAESRDAAEAVPLPAPAGWTPPRPGISIVALPFDNLSGDPDQEFFCDGLVNDIISDLSRFPDLLVISANSAFAYKNKHRKIQDIAAELDVRYLLEGSVQRMAGRVRVNAQLIEGINGHHIWADRFERDQADLFALQDEIIQRVVGSLPGRLRDIEGQRAHRKDPVELNAYEAYLRGAYLYSIESEAALARCREQFERAIRLDPSFARAWGYLAYIAIQRWIAGWADESVLQEAEEHARLAVSLDATDYANHWDLAMVYLNTRRFDQAMESYARAAHLNPNDADLLAEMADAQVFAGESAVALHQLQEAMRRNPFHPDWYRWVLSWALFNLDRSEEALAELQRMNRPPQHTELLRAALHAVLGDQAAAGKALASFVAYRPWSIAKERARITFRHARDEQRWLAALEAAGLPKE
jgi:TolB-like protein/class 3 adenylate cyclase/cytochrome c-type biogenesis protein CcmH/NrfG